MNRYASFLVLFGLCVGCKTTSTVNGVPIVQEVETAVPSDTLPTPAPTISEASTTVPNGSEQQPQNIDLCDSRPDVYRRENGKCALIPRPGVEGIMNITSGVIWQPDLKKCARPASNGTFRFCSGGAAVTIPLAKPTQGEGKVVVRISFNCKSFPSQNSFKLTIADEFKVTLASKFDDEPIFSSEIDVSSSLEKVMNIDFVPNYSADYPADCKIYLIENRLVGGD